VYSLAIRGISSPIPHEHADGDAKIMLALHRERAAAGTPHEQTALDRRIAAIDARIDRLVHDLHGLAEEEIKLMEGA